MLINFSKNNENSNKTITKLKQRFDVKVVPLREMVPLAWISKYSNDLDFGDLAIHSLPFVDNFWATG